MSSLLYSLGRFSFRARWLILLIWVAVLAVMFAGTGLLSVGTNNTYEIPGTQSQDALDALARTFPQASNASAQLVAVAPAGESVRDPAIQSAIQNEIAAIKKIPQVASAADPYASNVKGNISSDNAAALVPVQFTVATSAAVHPATEDALQEAGRNLQKAMPHGSQVAVGGQVFSQDAAGISVTELLGLLVALIVLIFTFGSFVAAGMPLASALVGVGVSLSVILMFTRFMTITSTTPLLALMLGLAVGIDYSLFIISRHQDQLKEGIEPEESAARSVATAGSAVVFAAVTVIIALVGLAVAGIPFLTTMGVAAAFGVAVAVVVSVTLTPALLGFARWRLVGKKYRPSARGAQHGADADADVDGDAQAEADAHDAPKAAAGAPTVPRGFFGGWVRGVTRWPIATVAVVVILLGLATLPAMSLRLSLPDAGSLPTSEPGRIAYDLIAKHFGPGYNGPLLVTGSVIQSTDPVTLMNDIGDDIAKVPGVAAVPLSTPNQAGDTGIVQVIPKGAPDSAQTEQVVATLRGMHDQFQKKYGVSLSITGYTAAGIDISERLGAALLPFAALVVGLSLILLAMVFRSVVVPVTAALGYLLSIGTAFGITSLVYESGYLAGPLHVAALGSVISFMPIILMGVLFGLAMDYEVFLVSRMREDYVHHGHAREAIHRGFVGSGRVVTAAAIIMFAVFAAFIPEGDASIQPIAIGLAVGVAVDAFVVRMTLIPAVLVMFGHQAWWFPRWLDKALPSFDVEGEGLHRELAVQGWPESEEPIAIAAEAITVSGPDGPILRGLDLLVPAGDVLLVRGPTGSGKSALLSVLAGRMGRVDGRLKVAGFALPMRASAVRSRVALVRLDGARDPGAAVSAALARQIEVVVIDDIDAVRRPAEAADVARALDDADFSARARGLTLTVVASCADPQLARALMPPGSRIVDVALADESPSLQPVAVI